MTTEKLTDKPAFEFRIGEAPKVPVLPTSIPRPPLDQITGPMLQATLATQVVYTQKVEWALVEAHRHVAQLELVLKAEREEGQRLRGLFTRSEEINRELRDERSGLRVEADDLRAQVRKLAIKKGKRK